MNFVGHVREQDGAGLREFAGAKESCQTSGAAVWSGGLRTCLVLTGLPVCFAKQMRQETPGLFRKETTPIVAGAFVSRQLRFSLNATPLRNLARRGCHVAFARLKLEVPWRLARTDLRENLSLKCVCRSNPPPLEF